MMLSEYGGCSYAFSGFYTFNSFDISDFEQTLDKCLSAISSRKLENEQMMKRADKYCSRSTFKQWVSGFLRHLKQACDTTKNADFSYLGLE
jgi:trehalose-6-phosphate synthase